MTERKAGERQRAVVRNVIEIVLPALAFSLGVGLATGGYAAALVTGLAISGTIYLLYRLDRALLHPRLKRLSHDWLQVGLEMAFSVLDHLLGAVLALLVCSRILGFAVVPSAAWLALGGMVIVFPIIHGTETALRFYRQLQEKERLEARLRALAAQAELRALKAQINPHFLFNTLNTIAQLISADPSRAETVVEQLAEVFRYTLVGSEREFVPLREELAFVDAYLSIEQARFGERLQVRRAIAPTVLDMPIPSLILQPLVENAIAHGRDEGGIVDLTIEAQPANGGVVIAIRDRGPGVPRPIPAGTGLRNVDERLRRTYEEARGLEIRDNTPRGAMVVLHVPWMPERMP